MPFLGVRFVLNGKVQEMHSDLEGVKNKKKIVRTQFQRQKLAKNIPIHHKKFQNRATRAFGINGIFVLFLLIWRKELLSELTKQYHHDPGMVQTTLKHYPGE